MWNTNIKKEMVVIIKQTKNEIFFKLSTTIMIRFFLLIIPVFFSKLIKSISTIDKKSIYINIIYLIIITILYYLSEWVNQIAYYQLYNNVHKRLSSKVLKATVSNSMFSLSRVHLSEYTNIMINDISTITSFFCNSFIWVIKILEFIYIYYYFFSIDRLILLITFVISIVMIGYILLLGNTIEEKNNMSKNNLDINTATIHDVFMGIKEIKCLNIFNQIHSIYKDKNDNYLKNNSNYIIFVNKINYLIYGILSITKFLVCLYSALLIINGKMELGILLIIYDYYGKIIDNFSTITSISSESRNLNVSFKRINKLLEYSNLPPATIDKQNYKIEGNIYFKNILYGFKSNPILKNTSFFFAKNKINLISGNGSENQECIFELLLKLNKQHEGEIYIDNININYFTDSKYYGLLSIVDENPYFFNISIKENLMFYEKNFQVVKNVCRLVNIDQYIQSLSNGYDSVMNDISCKIPTEYLYLLGFARMLLKKANILLIGNIIDKISQVNKMKVIDILCKLKTNHTIIILSNDIDIKQIADVRFILQNKKIIPVK